MTDRQTRIRARRGDPRQPARLGRDGPGGAVVGRLPDPDGELPRRPRRGGESTTLDPRQVSILVDGAVELLDQAAAAALDEEAERAAVLERELASRKSATLH